jgi:Protein of unknown function (DUF3179)
VDGVVLRFHLAGINNQNFLMRDEQTGTYWQQITGLAVAGPLRGKRLAIVAADELSFSLWKKEQPAGTVLKDAAPFVAGYAPKNWDVRMAKAPTVISYAQPGLGARDLMVGVHAAGASRAFSYNAILKEKLIADRVGPQAVLVMLGPDNRSVRVFERRIPGAAGTPQFYRLTDGFFLMDAETGSEWNFQGCAVAGRLKGTCLARVEAIKDYWFDWRNYNPATTVYGIRQKIR